MREITIKITDNGVTQELYYIGDKTIYVKQAGQADKIYYAVKDHLGSIMKLVDNNGTTVFEASYDPWGKQTVTNNTFKFHRGFTGHEHLPEFNLINMNGRMYDPILGRFLSPDPFVQMPDFSQSFNRYSYCINNPLRYTDPGGEWFGIDDLLVGAGGFIFGYLSHGISTGNWGWNAVGAGGLGAASAWLGYNTAGLASGAITNSTWNYMGSMAINTVANQVMPSMYVPIGNNFGIGVSPAFGWGGNGLTGGFNFTGTYTNGDFAISGGFGLGNAGNSLHGGITYYDRPNDQYFSYYANYFGKDAKGHNQLVGGLGYRKDEFSLRIENDVFAFGGQDRWRTSAVELGFGNFILGTNVYTNDPKGEAIAAGIDPKKAVDYSGESNLWGPNTGERGAWKNGQVIRAPLYVGIRNGRQTVRFGYSHPAIQDATQNFVHRYVFFGRQNYYNRYNDFEGGARGRWYGYSGYYNPFTLY